ncbi:MAG: hypothetical protein JNN04_06905 [Cyclobacteriaceae bacterium]|nr:hypothetical protein [Cyclobacteriaceae bacterium]
MKFWLTLFLFILVYRPSTAQVLNSGLPIGTECPAFDPHHVSGPDRNSRACPMCKYGSRQGVMIWVNHSDWDALEPIARRLESEIKTRGLRQFRAFIIYMNPAGLPLAQLLEESRKKADAWKLEKTALVCVPSPTDPESAGLFQINPDPRVKNTVMVYSRRKVAHKVINLNAGGLDDLVRTCDEIFLRNPL